MTDIRICMFDLDGTVSSFGVLMGSHPSSIQEAFKICQKRGWKIVANTNRPPFLAWLIRLPEGCAFSKIYCNIRYARLGWIIDWILGQEYKSKIENMDRAANDGGLSREQILLVDNNQKTVEHARQSGFVAVHAVHGVDESTVRLIRDLGS